MKHPNLFRRGHLFWWRRKITIGGTLIPIDLPLRTANFYQARAIADRLSAALERLRMTYGERGTAIAPATLKQIFQDAMRWQLDRIRMDQIGSSDPIESHAHINRIYAELWRFYARNGSKAKWRLDTEKDQLTASGWSAREIEDLSIQHARHSYPLISGRQLNHYAALFGIKLMSTNEDRIERVICSARAAACEAATKELGKYAGDLSHWTEETLAAEGPFPFEALTRSSRAAMNENAPQHPAPILQEPAGTAEYSTPPARLAEHPVRPTKSLKSAMAECIAAYEKAGAWSADTKEQVRTAIRLFDFACGEDAAIEGIGKADIQAFRTLCEQLPNRWGRTAAEISGGLTASLARAKTMDPAMLGMSQTTVNKHLTWISKVLEFAASDQGGNHEPAEPTVIEKAIKETRRGLGRKAARSDRKRARELRAAWTKDEVRRLLSAPIWTGCRSLDHRFELGSEIYHDGFYWLTLMLPLYGGRSSELTGLSLSDVHEEAALPFFRIDYSDVRALKNVQSVRSLPVHPELIRLGFIDYVQAMREAGHKLLFPEMHSARSKSFASTFYKTVFKAWRAWAFPTGSAWQHRERGAIRDKDVHSFRGTAATLMKGEVPDSVLIDILGHEGGNETKRSYAEEASLEAKLKALAILSPLTAHIPVMPLRPRPDARQKFGARRGRADATTKSGVQSAKAPSQSY